VAVLQCSNVWTFLVFSICNSMNNLRQSIVIVLKVNHMDRREVFPIANRSQCTLCIKTGGLESEMRKPTSTLIYLVYFRLVLVTCFTVPVAYRYLIRDISVFTHIASGNGGLCCEWQACHCVSREGVEEVR
jgi:hypothetical protein